MPNVGLELTTLRSRVTCCTNWASQEPPEEHLLIFLARQVTGNKFLQFLFAWESISPLLFFFNVFLIFIFFYFWDRERAWMGEGQRERETQNQKQAPSSEPSAQSLTRGSNSQTTRSWPGWSRTLNRLCHPGAPPLLFFKLKCSWHSIRYAT